MSARQQVEVIGVGLQCLHRLGRVSPARVGDSHTFLLTPPFSVSQPSDSEASHHLLGSNKLQPDRASGATRHLVEERRRQLGHLARGWDRVDHET
eukprot:scaffold39238_cov36-Phaeocystis_antarctica.AAC.4